MYMPTNGKHPHCYYIIIIIIIIPKVDEPSPEPDMGAVSHTPFGLKPVQLKWMTEVKYDDNGKIVDMVKLDPTKFPSHR